MFSDREFDEMVDERLEVLKGELQKYQSKLMSKDYADDLLVSYKLDDEDVDMLGEAESTCKFYAMAQAAAEANE